MKRGTNAQVFLAFRDHWTRIEGRDSWHNGKHNGRNSWGYSDSPTLRYDHESGILYSWGTILARWLDRKTILLNADMIRGNDSDHMWAVRNLFRDYHSVYNYETNRPKDIALVDVSHSLLGKHGIDMEVADVKVLALTEDIREHTPESVNQRPNFEAEMREKYHGIGMHFTDHYGQTYHVAGGSLILANGKLLWSAIDFAYFCCEIDQEELKAVQIAWPSLEPIQAVQLCLMPAPIRGNLKAERQGEFFFVPVTLTAEPTNKHKWVRFSDGKVQGWPVNMGHASWGRRTADANTAHHTAREAVYWGEGQEGVNPAYRKFVGLAKGDVRDFQHRMLVFQDKGWHEVWHNTQLASYSADGKNVRID